MLISTAHRSIYPQRNLCQNLTSFLPIFLALNMLSIYRFHSLYWIILHCWRTFSKIEVQPNGAIHTHTHTIFPSDKHCRLILCFIQKKEIPKEILHNWTYVLWIEMILKEVYLWLWLWKIYIFLLWNNIQRSI